MNIQPHNGYGRLLPNEQQQLDILYAPHFSQIICNGTNNTEYNFSIICVTAFSVSGINRTLKMAKTSTLEAILVNMRQKYFLLLFAKKIAFNA